MRRASASTFVAALLALVLATAAAAAPKVTFQTTPVAIPGFPGTGDILGAGAEVEVKVTIAGTEYGGFPSPLVGMTIDAPHGVEVTSKGFGSCAPAALEADGPPGCPRSSRAGPTGEGLGVVSFGGERVNEKVSLQSFFAPTGGLTFYAVGRTPTSFEILEKGYWSPASAPYGPQLTVELPLVETVPGADDASILSFRVKVGAAYRRAGKTVSYITLPRQCPKGGAPLKAELKFMSGETVTISYRQPCPKHRVP
ncbi:MAG TPA: hypothetical protein VGL37_05720 [Solirubrobacteraceae bacterium]|jgi:hypothetical protein